ncbi:hypothetical protein Micbo1qcDRAFT_168931 [Microdochium bolleyi]|uniref:DUF3500 domain-containing protein n=1 Tax=Microdochium bolleyi TaxID=196109 RepID=A0A136ILX2_9PEZI|nr:hypothetical protein Micbo1qcDRAFT_168931 [Microdochium bolleyi]
MADNIPAGVVADKAAAFRQHLPDLSTPRFTTLAASDAHSHAAELLEHRRPPWLYGLYEHWMRLLQEPFKGVTNDGVVRPGLFKVRDEGVDMARIVQRAGEVLRLVDEVDAAASADAAATGRTKRTTTTLRDRTVLHIDSPEWRTWSNPEFLLSDKGIRLDEHAPALRDAVMAVVSATLSPEGYDKAVAAMRINGFLGQLVGGEKVMNEWSYNFVLFAGKGGIGEGPSVAAPWGWALYGHHLCLSVFLYGSQIVVSPWFTGAEPNVIDAGPYAGTRILVREEALGLQLVQSLSSGLRRKAVVYEHMKDPAMPKGRWNHDDQRHLCGAYRDNRVVPYEGVCVGSEMSPAQVAVVEAIVEEYLLYLPKGSREAKMRDVREWLGETYFCWIGGTGDDDAFYYRVQSPVVLVEFDHHSGVFLTNEEPAKFHVHTLLRTPNGGDYGMALRRECEGSVEQGYIWEG